MKKQLLVACSLLFFSATVTFAQSAMGTIMPQSQLAGDKQDGPGPKAVFDQSFKLSVDNTIQAGSATLRLKRDALVIETMESEPDIHTREVWSIRFSRPAKEMEFQSDGNLVVRDLDNKILWAANSSAPNGRRLVLTNWGKLLIFDAYGTLVWEK